MTASIVPIHNDEEDRLAAERRIHRQRRQGQPTCRSIGEIVNEIMKEIEASSDER